MHSAFDVLHHHIYHLLFGVALYLILIHFGKDISFLFLIIGTFLPDLDHLINWFNANDKTTEVVEHELEDGRRSIPKRIDLAIKDYWKKGFNKLLFHNLIALIFVTVFLFLFRGHIGTFSLLAGFFAHQIFDICGDLLRWHNINHWFWKK